MWKMPGRVILTPHVAGYSPRIAGRHLQVLLDNIGRFLHGDELLNVVNSAASGIEEWRSGFCVTDGQECKDTSRSAGTCDPLPVGERVRERRMPFANRVRGGSTWPV
ncbi:MAG: hypothetical protein U0791_08845 [Gemmataceae bacterium]